MQHIVFAISGPTGSGKTEWGIKLAAECNGAVIAADSRTVYRGLDIGTNKATYELPHTARQTPLGPVYRIQGVDHYGLDLCDPSMQFTAADFQTFALRAIDEIGRQGKLPILVGGTGLYIQSVLDGYQFPARAVLPDRWRHRSTEELLQELVLWDAASAERIDPKNRARVERALAHAFQTGQSFRGAQQKRPPAFAWQLFVIDPDPADLARRLAGRIDRWLDDGLLDEVRTLRAAGIPDERLRSFGFMYSASLDRILGAIDESLFRRRLAADLRSFTKRQLTWWRRHPKAQFVRRYADMAKAVKQSLKRP